MSKAIFPVAAVYAHRDILRRGNDIERIYPDARHGPESLGLYTAAQVEAYAAAKVREALEEAAQACEARIGTHAPGMTPEDVEDCDEEARLCAGVVRALIPKE